ncbi:IQ motif-containing 1 [Hyphodiscus hymeniophilus]|uniref:IQ motif-containing 1 n=1 Tax=Hyphodiscus hymeniophilus TaxID=353542 RepID=A0A9P6VPX4_9HELO|nr:IQ motif-containing 1 [Hyphodiscus hymeniophilus]
MRGRSKTTPRLQPSELVEGAHVMWRDPGFQARPTKLDTQRGINGDYRTFSHTILRMVVEPVVLKGALHVPSQRIGALYLGSLFLNCRYDRLSGDNGTPDNNSVPIYPSSNAPLQEFRKHSHAKHDSKVSVATKASTRSTRSHKEYIDSLEVPCMAELERISTLQERKEEEHIMQRLSQDHAELSLAERVRAAALIQRNYRGHRERRMLDGMSLDPSTRWVEAIKEAQYRNMTQPRPRASMDVPTISLDGSADQEGGDKHSAARQNWKKIGLIARRAGGDEDSESENSGADEDANEKEREERRKRRMEKKMERQKAAKIMDLQYFLEMVDLKHRYGSNLRTYHAEWKQSQTQENFFYWLDYGEGRYIDCQGCPREQLDREQVRYLSKEERLDYLVKIDKEGRLCWAKNGARIDTTEKFKDSIHGIVSDTDPTPAFAPIREEAATGLQDTSSETSESSHESEHGHEADDEADRANKYATPTYDKSKGMKKVKHVSASTIFNKLLRGSVKKNTWIFVADTSFRLYVGIKQSGAFQHSSFLHGARISAAGLIKIKNGRLSKLSPLSGHYRPPVSNFKAFVHSLKDEGVDMSHVSISRSYAVLVGLEAYVKSRKRGKKLVQKLVHSRDKILSPEEVARREEEERDKTESAAREQRFLELQQQADRDDREQNANIRLLNKLRVKSREPHEGETRLNGPPGEKKHGGRAVDLEAPGTGPESAIAPEGSRSEEPGSGPSNGVAPDSRTDI